VIALGVVIATVAAFVVSAAYYGIAPAPMPSEPVPQRAMGALVLVELLRNLAVAALIGGLLAAANWSGLVAGLLVGSSLSILPVVLLAGSVFHEGVLPRRAAVHALDWLIKLAAMGAILGLVS
jgi:hypothetical protein